MNYSISIKRSTAKALARIAREDRVRIIEAIDRLRTNPAAGGVLKGEYAGLRRIRIGHYRVVYEVQDQQLVVLVIGIFLLSKDWWKQR